MILALAYPFVLRVRLKMSVPSHAKLERALREAVRDVYKNGDLENLTVKRIRKAVQEKLALEEDFFKTNDHWKDESKSVIQSEVVCLLDIGRTHQDMLTEERTPTMERTLTVKLKRLHLTGNCRRPGCLSPNLQRKRAKRNCNERRQIQ